MKKILILLIAFSFSSCEKDDICDESTSTTPRMIVEFYDVANPTTLKSVANLVIVADGLTTGIKFTAKSKIQVPLNTELETTIYKFIQNGDDDILTNDNTDVIKINYTTNIIYVSRACGYKKTFTLKNPNGVAVTDATTPDGFWIQNISIVKTNIDNENETHVKIYF